MTGPRRRRLLLALPLLGAGPWPAGLHGAPALPAPAAPRPAWPEGSHCVVPAKAGGGFDLGCRLAQVALQAWQPTAPALALRYQPGGIGALAYRDAVGARAADAATLVAFSSGSLLNLVQGRFGPPPPREVRWVAGLGLDHGVIVVHRDAPWHHLGQLLGTLRAQPAAISFGAGGAIGSQDWMKAALLARRAGVGHAAVRVVAFEGGGDALAALAGRHVQVLAGDAAELGRALADSGERLPLRVLAVLAAERLPGRWATQATAREQGVDIVWPILRGVYLGPLVSDTTHQAWTQAFAAAMALPGYPALREAAGLQPPSLTGPALDAYIESQLAEFRRLAQEFGLPVRAKAGR